MSERGSWSTERARASRATVRFGVWCTIASPAVTELVALMAPDYVCVDCQHGLVDYSSMVPMLQSMARTGVRTVVRVAGHDGAAIGKVLDAGADAVIVPYVEDAEQAARVAAACRYPPLGVRSYGPIRAASVQGVATPAALNERVRCYVMIETATGVANADAICATDGVDGVYIGPADLAVSLGETPGGLVPGPHADAVAHVLDRCLAHGIVPGIHAYDGATARSYAEMGFRMVTVGVDFRLLTAAVAEQLRTARA